MEAVRAKAFTMWRTVDELRNQRNVVVLYKNREQALREMKYHNNEVEKGRGDNPLFVVFYGDLGDGPFYLTPISLDGMEDAKVPIWTPVYISRPLDNCEALAYWLLRYPICGRAISEQAAEIIGKCARMFEEAGSEYRIDCPPPSPAEIAGVDIRVYAPVEEIYVGNTPIGKIAIYPAEGRPAAVKYTDPINVLYALFKNPDVRLRVEGAPELALRLLVCRQFGLCVVPADMLAGGRPLSLNAPGLGMIVRRPRVYITDRLEYAPAVDETVREALLEPVENAEEALLNAANEYRIPPPPEIHVRLCVIAKRTGAYYRFSSQCDVMLKEELLAIAKNIAGGVEPRVVALHPHMDGIPRALIVRDNDGLIYLVLESADAEFYRVENKVVVDDLCSALRRNNMAPPSAHPILGPRCFPPPAPSEPPSPPTDIAPPQPRPPPLDYRDIVMDMAEELAEALGERIDGDPAEWLMRRWDDVTKAVVIGLKCMKIDEECLRRCTRI